MSEFIILVFGSVAGYYFGKEKFRFESAHKRRIEVIEGLYQKLIITHRAFKDLMNPIQLGEQAKEQKKQNLVKVANDFSNYFFERKIFFEQDLSKEIEAINSELQNIWIDWEYLVEFPGIQPMEKMTNWQNTWKRVDGDMRKVLESLEERFRKILGI